MTIKSTRQAVHDDPLEPLLTIPDVMQLLKVSRPKVYDLMAEGLPIIKFGRSVRFSPADFRRWLANRKRIA